MSALAAIGAGTRSRREAGVRLLCGLLLPAVACEPVREVEVADSSAAISALLGGVLLDDAPVWKTPGRVWVTVYLGEYRAEAADNPRLSVAATRLGLTDRAFHALARGDALLLGASSTGADVDVPQVAVTLMRVSGVPVAPVDAPWPEARRGAGRGLR